LLDEWGAGDPDEDDEEDWTVEGILNTTYGEGGYKWRLECLNTSCGPLRPSNLVLVAGRPNMGKTTLMMSEVSFMSKQIKGDRPVLVVHNEEGPQGELQLRWMSSVLGATAKQISEKPGAAMDAYIKTLGYQNRIIVKHMPGASVQEIEALLVKHNPAIIAIDQLRLCSGFGQNSTEVERLKELYRWARIQASTFGPFFTVHQAGDTAEGLTHLQGNMLEGCKTEIQGALDLQLMIGSSDPMGTPRTLNIVKNKLAGSIDSDPQYRHHSWEVKINPSIARYEGYKDENQTDT
jgi:replicative DNA helicase